MATGRVSKAKGKILDLPNAPTIGTVTVAGTTASIPFTPDSSGAGGPTFFYRVQSTAGGFTATGTSSPISLPGLTPTTAFTFTVSAVNPSGSGTSAASNSITTGAVASLTGGTQTEDSTHYYRTFTSSGTLTVADLALTADVMLIAGGGGGGQGHGAGGGAGGFRVLTDQTLGIRSYTVTVGNGGAGDATTEGGNTGGNTSLSGSGFTTIASSGGGGGAGRGTTVKAQGGSGGGATFTGNPGFGNVGGYSPAEGFRGGYAQFGSGAGGGSATAVGGNAPNGASGGTGANGSSAYSSWGSVTSTGENVSGTRWYAGGGGAAGWESSGGANASGGDGGGGDGQYGTGSAGMSNTGGGGGGSHNTTGGAGGSGLVIIRYLKSAGN